MGRGRLNSMEIEILRNNPHVVDVNENRIIYATDFKFYFMDEYHKGRKPKEIFEGAGFDPKILGSKRIERASARWRESDAAGTLGLYDRERGKCSKDGLS